MATDVIFISQLAARVKKVEHGFIDVRKAADEVESEIDGWLSKH